MTSAPKMFSCFGLFNKNHLKWSGMSEHKHIIQSWYGYKPLSLRAQGMGTSTSDNGDWAFVPVLRSKRRSPQQWLTVSSQACLGAGDFLGLIHYSPATRASDRDGSPSRMSMQLIMRNAGYFMSWSPQTRFISCLVAPWLPTGPLLLIINTHLCSVTSQGDELML